MLVQRDRKRDERTALIEQAAAVWQTATSKEYVERDRKDIGAAGNIPETCWWGPPEIDSESVLESGCVN
jgi:hypothetical protein